MNRRLMDYNPEGEGTEGEVLLFGMTPPPPRAASGQVNELELAAAFLDAGSPCSLGALVNRLMRYASLKSGRPINPDVARALAPRLRRAGSIVGGLLHTRKGDPTGRRNQVDDGRGRAGLRDRARRIELRRQGIRNRALLRTLCARSGPSRVDGPCWPLARHGRGDCREDCCAALRTRFDRHNHTYLSRLPITPGRSSEFRLKSNEGDRHA